MEEQEFLSGIYLQNCGDSLRVLKRVGKDKASRALYECEFLTYPCKVISTKSHILEGKVYNYYIPNKFGCYFGVGKYTTSNSKNIHSMWTNIFRRCYDKNDIYYCNYGAKDITVCEEWKCFQNFAAWYEENSSWNTNNYFLEIDKDILSNRDNKIYSPSTCLLIPSEINKFLVGFSLTSGIEERCGHFRCRVQHKDKIFKSTTFDTFEEARIVYLNKKQEFWIELINSYELPISLKNILINFKFL